jgi:hypothetical protein
MARGVRRAIWSAIRSESRISRSVDPLPGRWTGRSAGSPTANSASDRQCLELVLAAVREAKPGADDQVRDCP